MTFTGLIFLLFIFINKITFNRLYYQEQTNLTHTIVYAYKCKYLNYVSANILELLCLMCMRVHGFSFHVFCLKVWYTYICAQLYEDVHSYRGQRGRWDSFSRFLTEPEASCSGQTHQPARSVYLHPYLQHQDHRHKQLHLVFLCRCWGFKHRSSNCIANVLTH